MVLQAFNDGGQCFLSHVSNVAEPHRFDADPDADPGCHFDADQDPELACHFDADPDLTFHFDADPNPDPSFQIKAQTLKKCSNIGSYFIYFRIRILPFNLMRTRITARKWDYLFGQDATVHSLFKHCSMIIIQRHL